MWEDRPDLLGRLQLRATPRTTALRLSGYDIYSEWLASDQIKQMNQNADQYLRAVADLQARIHQTVNQLNQYQAENPIGMHCSDR